MLAGGREPDIGIQHREQPAARAGGLPPERDPGRLLGPGELADLDPDQLGQADRAHARKCACLPAVGILGRGDQRTALGQLCQPFAGHGEADLEEYLITNEHPCIPPSWKADRQGRWSRPTPHLSPEGETRAPEEF